MAQHAAGADAAGVLDLGVLEGPVLVFGGAYSNLQALEAVLAEVRRLGIPAGRVVHTGDAVAYCAQPREATELLRASGVHCLLGNCEESVGVGKADCGCGFPEDSACNRYSVNWYAHVSREISDHPHLRDWMAALPRRIEFVLGGRRLAVVHGSPRDISEFVWPSTPDAELERMLAALPPNIEGIVAGHSGIPFARLFGRCSGSNSSRLWLNAGVVGMPANDGTPRGWFAVLTPGKDRELEVSIRALAYKAKDAAEAIYSQPQLVRGYADSLLSGIWPSHDILPLQEQMATGIELKEGSLTWAPDLEATSGPKAGTSPSSTTLVTALAAMSAVALAITILLSMRERTKSDALHHHAMPQLRRIWIAAGDFGPTYWRE